ELSMNAQYNNAGTQVAQNITVKVPITAAEGTAQDPATNYRVFQAGNRYEYNTNWDISWTNMTIQGGSIDNDAQRNQYGHGGAIYVRGNNANLEFNIVEISDSTASGSGGGLYVSTDNDKEIDFPKKGGSITITMQDVRFDNNKAAQAGGGIYSYAERSSSITISTTNSPYSTLNLGTTSEFTNNTSTHAGGAIYSFAEDEIENSDEKANSTIHATDITMTENIAGTSGGAIYSRGYNNSTVTITTDISDASILSDNEATANDGGAVYSYAHTEDSTVSITNTTIANNEAKMDGGAVYSYANTKDSTVSITNTTIENNESFEGAGGAVFSNAGQSSSVTITDDTLHNNTAKNNGGAVYSKANTANSTVSITNTTIKNNESENGAGGAVFSNAGQSSSVTITDATLHNNTAKNNGGAVYSNAVNANSTVSITNTTINENESFEGAGGAVFSNAGQSSNVTITDATLHNNIAKNNGGAVYSNAVNANSTVSITSTTINDNESFEGAGGAVFSNAGQSSNVTITDAMLHQNTAKNNGGAVYSNAVNANSTVSITNTTINENESENGSGGAVYSNANIANSTVSITNTTIDNNKAQGAGGAVFSNARQTSSVTITDGTLHQNTATEGSGGAVYSNARATATTNIKNVTIKNNTAGASGGAVYNNVDVNYGNYNQIVSNNIRATVTIDNVLIQDNTATNGKGGAIYNNAKIIFNNNEEQYNNLAITTTADVNISESSLIQNKATGDGAGVYNYAYVKAYANVATPAKSGGTQDTRYVDAHAKANVSVFNSTIARNTITTDGAGAGIYNYSESEARNSGKRYKDYNWNEASHSRINSARSSAETITTVANSTIAGNVATKDSGGIYSYANNPATYTTCNQGHQHASGTGGANKLYLLNSIVYANYVNNNGNDIYFVGDRVRTHYNAYSIYGKSNVHPDSPTMMDSTQLRTSENNVKRVFTTVEQDANGNWIPVMDNTSTIPGRTISITQDGEAAYRGTLIGKVDGHYFYFHQAKQQWISFTDTENTYVFDEAAEKYGLPENADFNVLAQNLVDRVSNQPFMLFNVGAHAFSRENWRTGSLVVTTTDDVIDFTDNVISLREALIYAAAGVLALDGTSTVTFHENLFTPENNYTITLELSDKYEELRITDGLAGKVFKIYNDPKHTITLKPATSAKTYNETTHQWEDNDNPSPYRILQIGSFYDTTNTWDVSINNMTIEGGNVTETEGNTNGGIIFAQGANVTLNLNTMILKGGKTDGLGGAIYTSGKVNLTIDTSSILGSSASEGGGIYVNGNDAIIIIDNSTLADNTATGSGAGIYMNGQRENVTIANSTISANFGGDVGAGIYFSYGKHAEEGEDNNNSTLNTLNSIIYANYSGTVASDIFFPLDEQDQTTTTETSETTELEKLISEKTEQFENGTKYTKVTRTSTTQTTTVIENYKTVISPLETIYEDKTTVVIRRPGSTETTMETIKTTVSKTPDGKKVTTVEETSNAEGTTVITTIVDTSEENVTKTKIIEDNKTTEITETIVNPTRTEIVTVETPSVGDPTTTTDIIIVNDNVTTINRTIEEGTSTEHITITETTTPTGKITVTESNIPNGTKKVTVEENNGDIKIKNTTTETNTVVIETIGEKTVKTTTNTVITEDEVTTKVETDEKEITTHTKTTVTTTNKTIETTINGHTEVEETTEKSPITEVITVTETDIDPNAVELYETVTITINVTERVMAAQGTWNVAYTIYSKSNIVVSEPSFESIQLKTNQEGVKRIFVGVKTVTVDSVDLYAPYLYDGTETAGKGYTIEIKKTGEAGYRGTLIGRIGQDYFYHNQDTDFWTSFTSTDTYQFNLAKTKYGLTDGTVNPMAQNEIDRIKYRKSYVVGAYAYISDTETPSLIVTTLEDVVNVNDGLISLREALGYACAGTNLWEYDRDTPDIIFANKLFIINGGEQFNGEGNQGDAVISLTDTEKFGYKVGINDTYTLVYNGENAEQRWTLTDSDGTQFQVEYDVWNDQYTSDAIAFTIDSGTVVEGDTFTVQTIGTDTITIRLRAENDELIATNGLDDRLLSIDATRADNTEGNLTTTTNRVVITVDVDPEDNIDERGTIYDETAGTWIKNPDAANFRILRVGSEDDTETDWNITLKNLDLQGGHVELDDQGGHGGNIFIKGRSIELNLDKVTIANGHAEGNGGGIYAYSDTTKINTNLTTIKGNIADDKGGAIYSYGASNSTIVTKNSTIGGNTAQTGGAIASEGNSYSTIILENSTIAANIATNHGGGVYSKARDAKVFLYNSLLYGNYADKSDATSTSTSTNDLYFVKTMPDASGTLNIAYSIFGQSNVNPSSASVEAIQLNYREATLRRNFQFIRENTQGTKTRYLAQFSSPELTDNKDFYTGAKLYETVEDAENGRTIAVKYTGEVAYSGTLIGKVGNDYYFYNISQVNSENGFGTWVSFTNHFTYN
ncbi:MAG TPA: hypothetical protein P5543_11400, partial [Planctomycetota bacterium]|nr:hypothetical protein [Planctomycetota bacterium]